MSAKIIPMILTTILFLGYAVFIHGKPKHKFNIIQPDIQSQKKSSSRNLEEYDTYMVLYFNKDCNYSKGFQNSFRRNPMTIINRENNLTYSDDEELIIHKGYGIEIHFDEAVDDLGYFLSRDIDENMEYLVSVDLSNFDASSLDTMNGMFINCTSLESIDFSNLETSSVKDIGYMFSGCTSLKSIDLSTLDLSNIIRMNNIFYGCTSLESINLPKKEMESLYDMSYLFYGCTSLKSIDLSSLDTSSVEYINNIFEGCTSLESIDLSKLDF